LRLLYFHNLPKEILDDRVEDDPSGSGKKVVVFKGLKTGLANVMSIYGYLMYFEDAEQTVILLMNVSKFASQCLANMSQEMFFLTKRTRGGFILMFLLAYSAYVLGACMWIEQYEHAEEAFAPDGSCTTLGNCVFTMLRMTVYDGTGLDYAYWLSTTDKLLFAIVIIYLCATGFGIFNGLIGVFGTHTLTHSLSLTHTLIHTNSHTLIHANTNTGTHTHTHTHTQVISSTTHPQIAFQMQITTKIFSR